MTNQLPLRLEIIPTDGIIPKVQAHVPAGSTLTVTCLPHHGVEATVRASVQLGQLGYEVIPHLAARSIESRAQLAGMLRGCEAAGITEVFAIGGDAPEAAGPYGNSGRLMEDIADVTGGTMAIGVAGYPEGHPKHNELQMLDALLEETASGLERGDPDVLFGAQDQLVRRTAAPGGASIFRSGRAWPGPSRAPSSSLWPPRSGSARR
jgi:methylenetetrahydrofolate reductase (NADPH)